MNAIVTENSSIFPFSPSKMAFWVSDTKAYQNLLKFTKAISEFFFRNLLV